MHSVLQSAARMAARFLISCCMASACMLLIACILFDQPPSAVLDHGLAWLVGRYGFGGVFLGTLMAMAVLGIMWITFADANTEFVDPVKLKGAKAWRRYLFGHSPIRKRR